MKGVQVAGCTGEHHRYVDTEGRWGLYKLLYPSAVGCNPCCLTLRGIGCGETSPFVLVVPSLEHLGFLALFLGGPMPSVEVARPRSLTAWRPAACTKRERVTHKLLCSRS
jgi:hypothetical protein